MTKVNEGISLDIKKFVVQCLVDLGGSRLIETAGPPRWSASSSASFCFSLTQPHGSLDLSIGWVQISASDSFSC